MSKSATAECKCRGASESLHRIPVIAIHGDGEQVRTGAFTFQGFCDDCGLFTTGELVPAEWLHDWMDLVEQWKDRALKEELKRGSQPQQ